jgi:hypothetical protein
LTTLTSTLGSVTDGATADAAVKSLTDADATLGGLEAAIGGLSGDGRTALDTAPRWIARDQDHRRCSPGGQRDRPGPEARAGQHHEPAHQLRRLIRTEGSSDVRVAIGRLSVKTSAPQSFGFGGYG